MLDASVLTADPACLPADQAPDRALSRPGPAAAGARQPEPSGAGRTPRSDAVSGQKPCNRAEGCPRPASRSARSLPCPVLDCHFTGAARECRMQEASDSSGLIVSPSSLGLGPLARPPWEPPAPRLPWFYPLGVRRSQHHAHSAAPRVLASDATTNSAIPHSASLCPRPLPRGRIPFRITLPPAGMATSAYRLGL